MENNEETTSNVDENHQTSYIKSPLAKLSRIYNNIKGKGKAPKKGK